MTDQGHGGRGSGGQARPRVIAWVTPGEGQGRTGRIVGPSREVEDSWGEDDAPPAHSLPHMEIDANRPSDGHMPLLTCFSATNPGQGPCSPLQPGAYQPFSRAQTPGAGSFHCSSLHLTGHFLRTLPRCGSQLTDAALREASQTPSRCQGPSSYPRRNSGSLSSLCHHRLVHVRPPPDRNHHCPDSRYPMS